MKYLLQGGQLPFSTQSHRCFEYTVALLETFVSNKNRYRKLCGIEYHSVENMRLRKEISETYGILHAVQKCCVTLGIRQKASDSAVKNGEDNIHLENVCLIGENCAVSVMLDILRCLSNSQQLSRGVSTDIFTWNYNIS